MYTFTKNQRKWAFTNHPLVRHSDKPQEIFQKKKKAVAITPKSSQTEVQHMNSLGKPVHVTLGTVYFKCIIHDVLVQNLVICDERKTTSCYTERPQQFNWK